MLNSVTLISLTIIWSLRLNGVSDLSFRSSNWTWRTGPIFRLNHRPSLSYRKGASLPQLRDAIWCGWNKKKGGIWSWIVLEDKKKISWWILQGGCFCPNLKKTFPIINLSNQEAIYVVRQVRSIQLKASELNPEGQYSDMLGNIVAWVQFITAVSLSNLKKLGLGMDEMKRWLISLDFSIYKPYLLNTDMF